MRDAGRGRRRAFFSFDIDVSTRRSRPAPGTPEVAGLLPHEALALIRSLAGMRFSGFDVVEVVAALRRRRAR